MNENKGRINDKADPAHPEPGDDAPGIGSIQDNSIQDNLIQDDSWFASEILERFIRYARIETTSDPHIEEIPSTPGQWDLLHLLVSELEELGISDITLNGHGYLIARVPSNMAVPASPGAQAPQAGQTPPGAKEPPVIGFMAHVDTASDMSGKGVDPRVHKNHDGGTIPLEEGFVLSPDEFPVLGEYKGDTIITSDGTTLLGADDKAGIAEIMTALACLREHPELQHGEIEIIFTPDEETGKGMNLFPVEQLRSVCCYTLDGGEEGSIEAECFNACSAEISFTGSVIHLGSARGRLVNAVTMAGTCISMLPGRESPETTDGRYGYYAPLEVSGTLEKAKLQVFLRDFEVSGMDRRIRTLKVLAEAVESMFPGGKAEVNVKKQYANMREHICKNPKIMDLLEKALKQADAAPERRIIRGGTDGARLSEMGIPTPNIFTGCHNPHSRFEWAPLSTMVKASKAVVFLACLWARE